MSNKVAATFHDGNSTPRRLVVVGKTIKGFSTTVVQYAISDPNWSPQVPPGDREPDYDLIRKRYLEEQEDEL